ncbi:MAG: hypothetical protein KF686_04270 [Ramlibacter sp.]|nr:hypothetical protein [Ramlibacter sp.]
MTIVKSWPDVQSVAILDELLANGDRNIGNLLFDGTNKWIPIDYSRAKAIGPFPSPTWDGAEVRLDLCNANHLIDSLHVLDWTSAKANLPKIESAQIYLGVLHQFVGLPIPGAQQLALRNV